MLTILLERGVNPKVVSERLGHASVATTPCVARQELHFIKRIQPITILGDSRGCPTDVRWTLDPMETFWGEISDNARELMTHCAVESRALLDDGSYVCCVCWEPSMYDSRDKANTICVNYQHRRNNMGLLWGRRWTCLIGTPNWWERD